MMRIIGYAVTTAFLMAFNSLLSGWALTVLWGWFIVPTFHTPPLNLVPAIGLNLVISFLTYHFVDTETPDRSFGESLFRSFLVALFTVASYLGVGWVVHLFM